MARWRSREEWQQIVNEFEASGQTQRAFCAQRGISAYSLRRWRQQCDETPAAARPGAAPETAARLLPVRLRQASAGSPVAPTAPLTLVFTNGLRLEIQADTDARYLGQVIAAVREAAA